MLITLAAQQGADETLGKVPIVEPIRDATMKGKAKYENERIRQEREV